MKYLHANQKGLTLIEVLLVAITGGILLTSLSVSSGLYLNSYSATIDDQDLTLGHGIAMDRLLRAVTNAEQAEIQSATSMVVAYPDASTEQFTWSGTGGDPLYLSKDGGDPIVFVDGVTNLDFTANMASANIETPQVNNEEVLTFTSYPNSWHWESHTIEPWSMHGFTFKITSTEMVEKIVLTSIELMVSALPWQDGDMRLYMTEGLNEDYPAPWGDTIASVVIDNNDITDAYWDGAEWVIGWSTFDLPEDFTIQPNRFYTILLEPTWIEEAAKFKVATLDNAADGSSNNMVFIHSHDGGTSWDPPYNDPSIHQRDVPVHLHGDVHSIIRTPYQYVASVEVSLGLELGDAEEFGAGKAIVRGKSD